MLEVRGVNCYYGKMHVLFDVDLQVGDESVALLGPNGAGKTTLIAAIMGMVKPRDGEILFDGRSLREMQTHEIAKLGIALVPQERELFPLMSVADNLKAGADYIPNARSKSRAQLDLVVSLYPTLARRLRQPAGTLSGGEQRMLAIGRALMASPKLLILDEPSLGLQPSLVTELYRKLLEMKGRIAILVTEQNVRASLKAVDRGYVLENGRIAFGDAAEGLRHNPHVVKSFLGM